MQRTNISIKHKTLVFKNPAKTSRETLNTKDCYFIELWRNDKPGIFGLGECSPIWGLSPENKTDLELKLKEVESNIDYFLGNMSLLNDFPSLKFALEVAQLDLNNEGRKIIFKNDFVEGLSSIPINGLVWMGSEEFMYEQINSKIKSGFKCIKVKIGALDFEIEIKLLKYIRNHFSKDKIILRVDANGAFSIDEVEMKLNKLSELDIHSIEQPIKRNQWSEMSKLCRTSPIPIALDEELIGITDLKSKAELLDRVSPQYLVLKPSLHGGFSGCEEWIKLSQQRGIDWWITSYLESNIGLNAIAQWTSNVEAKGFQGLGTGGLFTNNISSPLFISEGNINFDPTKKWGLIK